MIERTEDLVLVVAAHGIVEYHDFLLGLIAEKRANPGNDLTSDIVHAQSDPPFSDGELVSTLTGRSSPATRPSPA